MTVDISTALGSTPQSTFQATNSKKCCGTVH